jgi:hypothetical protein
MTGIKEQFSTVFIFDVMGVVTGSVTATQFATGSCAMVRFKADPDNDGNFLLGHDPNNCVFPFAGGDDSGWVATSDLNRYWHLNLSGTNDRLTYWLQK